MRKLNMAHELQHVHHETLANLNKNQSALLFQLSHTHIQCVCTALCSCVRTRIAIKLKAQPLSEIKAGNMRGIDKILNNQKLSHSNIRAGMEKVNFRSGELATLHFN
jgi:hypothetical protein